ncbi:molybdopterin-dependent oxidoreductase [Caulobacter sp. LARHSG274]
MRFPLALAAAVAALAWTPALAQGLKVTVVGRDSIVLTPADLKALPRAKATFQAKGHAVTFEGAVLNAALLKAGVVSGDRLMGRYLNQVVVAKAADGFTSILSLAETDPFYRTNPVIIADTKDGQPLDAKEGPYRLVVDGDLHPSRSPRQVVSIEVKPAF